MLRSRTIAGCRVGYNLARQTLLPLITDKARQLPMNLLPLPLISDAGQRVSQTIESFHELIIIDRVVHFAPGLCNNDTVGMAVPAIGVCKMRWGHRHDENVAWTVWIDHVDANKIFRIPIAFI